MRRWGALLGVVGVATVAHAQAGRATPEIVGEATVDPTREINFASGIWPRRVYTGQQATYEIGIFLSESMRSRLRSNPQFVPPDVRSVIAYDLPLPGRLFSRTQGGQAWDVHVYSRALFPVAPGLIEVAPARLNWLVPLSNSIFAREEAHSATSSSHRLQVVPPPDEGRPADFTGAVGQLQVAARTDASPKRVGDPFVLTVTVQGIGNVGLFPRPGVTIPWAHVVAGPERVRVDSSSAIIRGDKAFEWVVTPRQPGRHEVPALRYPYFNPYTEQYEVSVTGTLPLSVSDGGLVAATPEDSAAAPRYELRRSLRGDVGRPWPASAWYWLGVLGIPLPALAARWRRRPARVRTVSSVERLTRWASAAVPDPVEVRRAFREAIGARVQTFAPSLTNRRTMERVLRRAGVTASTARDVVAMVDEMDAALYGEQRIRQNDLARRALALYGQVDAEAIPVGGGGTVARRSGATATGVMLLAAVALHAAATDRDATDFRSALQTWDAGDVAGARASFAELARRRPRAADAWMNAGTTAWALGDTAQAVVGWQRALRLEPMVDDARARLTITPSFRDGILGDIPPVPVNLVAAIALLVWAFAWWRRGPAPGRWLVTSFLLGGVALLANERHAGRRQVVIVGDESLRDLPAMSGTPGARVTVGETGRVLVGQGNWSRVRMADGREGWIDASRTADLELPRVAATN